eukprot:c25682_g1_i1.p1 GENE.c25682_g1_i1~~c25682_g1_i1.p1  ORF type:complete len:175 (-),score=29.67 c25682_g1_i1:20-544(-)
MSHYTASESENRAPSDRVVCELSPTDVFANWLMAKLRDLVLDILAHHPAERVRLLVSAVDGPELLDRYLELYGFCSDMDAKGILTLINTAPQLSGVHDSEFDGKPSDKAAVLFAPLYAKLREEYLTQVLDVIPQSVGVESAPKRKRKWVPAFEDGDHEVYQSPDQRPAKRERGL